MSPNVVPASPLVDVARGIDWTQPVTTALSDAADAQTRALIDGFVHESGPPPARFAWVVFGSHARRELHCASDQDSALFWQTEQAARTSYAKDLAVAVIDGLERFGLRPCDGGYMADTWSYSLEQWQQILRERVDAPTPDAVVDADVFLDLRQLKGALDVAPARAVLARGAGSPRLMHGLATAANSFPPPLHAFGRLPRGTVDLKKTGLAPIVLLARLYGLKARSGAVGTDERLADATKGGVLSEELTGRLRQAYAFLTRLRMQNQLRQIDAREYVTDTIVMQDLDDDTHDELRDAFKAIKSAQSVTSMTFRTDL
ncbi:MAG: hypothetical protein H6526_03205 [Actinobacteria bacterium]|nr:hypothetical protein [Actinomycetota bacterium]MCB8997837.1 hypothetical protein [Actinomycetota bacterium]MCB9414269.1 hypothetical protein [Actinomycetota bacterium]HRY09256.1 putative nucleotidyltransferase substrate binding domain-containing protein [Candidatus Nanopelagicales bacterium]